VSFISRWRLAVLLVIALVGWGLMSLKSMGKESWPDVEMPLGLVKVVYPGAPADLVEVEVTEPLEVALKGLPALASLDSSSIDNAALVLVEFELDADLRESLDALRDRVDEAEADLPDDVESVVVQQVATSNQPVYSFSVSGDLPAEVLRRQALAIRDRLEGLSGVSEVRISGLRDDQLQVLVHRRRLEAIGGTLSDVVGALEDAQSTAPVGRFESVDRSFSLDVERMGLDPDRMAALQVRSAATGDHVSLGSVATLERALSEASEASRVVSGPVDDRRAGDAIAFDVLRQPGADVPAVVRRVEAALDAARPELPPDLEIVVTADRGAEIIEGLELLFSNGFQAVLLVFLVLFGVLGARESIIAGLSIPLTFLATFGVLALLGQSINNLSLMALVIALGLLVDDFILVMEGMHEELAEGHAPLEAARRTLKNFALPSLSGTATTVAAFFPMAMLGGMEGRFIQVIPLTICVALVSSYLVSITLDTTFGALFLRKHEPGRITAAVGRAFDWMVATYRARIFPAALGSRRGRRLTLAAAVGAFGVSLLAAGQLDAILYPATDESQLGATFNLPPGTTLAQTRRLAGEVEALLADDPRVAHLSITAGARSGLAMSGPDSYLEPFQGAQLLGLTLELVPADERDQPSFEIAEELRGALTGLGQGRVEIHQVRMGASGDAPVSVQVTARSVEAAEALADRVHAEAAQVPGIVGLTDTRKPHAGAYRLALYDEALAFHGLDRDQVLQFLRYAISGTTAEVVFEDGQEVELEVGYDWREDHAWNAPAALEEILALEVPKFMGGQVPLAAIAGLTLKSAPIGINHAQRRHVVTVSADAEGSPVEAATALKARLAEAPLGSGEAIHFGGDLEKSAQTSAELGRALLIATGLIFAILVSQFRSFAQPFIILLTMPLAMTGVFIGFFVTGLPLSFPSMIGMVALAGIVVNDSIVLVDAINRGVRAEGLDPLAACLEGCTSRMRPILVTTITTVIGLVPLAMTDAVWAGLCMAIVYGISLATALTMLVIPAIYLGIERPPAPAAAPLEVPLARDSA